MARKCPRGFVCTDGNTVWLVIAVAVIVGVGLWWYAPATASAVPSIVMPEPKVIVMQQPPAGFGQRPDLYPEPVRRFGGGLPSIPVRGAAGPYEQVGILTQEGGSSTLCCTGPHNSAALWARTGPPTQSLELLHTHGRYEPRTGARALPESYL
jgi:hypothetical protein